LGISEFRNVTINGTARQLTEGHELEEAVRAISERNPAFRERVEKEGAGVRRFYRIEPQAVHSLQLGQPPMNIELWDKNFFNSIYPGKRDHCGGWDHWVKALEYAVDVFGWGRVRSNIVAGIEPKESTLAGVEYLASKGVICFAGAWCPNPGSALEGHRTPEPAWHWDMAKKVTSIFRKAGFTYDQLYDCSAAPTTLNHDIYKIEDGLIVPQMAPQTA
jgi:hypothetical protein